ncbi:unnamed protein product, partial [Amoebophrya sp. A25]
AKCSSRNQALLGLLLLGMCASSVYMAVRVFTGWNVHQQTDVPAVRSRGASAPSSRAMILLSSFSEQSKGILSSRSHEHQSSTPGENRKRDQSMGSSSLHACKLLSSSDWKRQGRRERFHTRLAPPAVAECRTSGIQREHGFIRNAVNQTAQPRLRMMSGSWTADERGWMQRSIRATQRAPSPWIVKAVAESQNTFYEEGQLRKCMSFEHRLWNHTVSTPRSSVSTSIASGNSDLPFRSFATIRRAARRQLSGSARNRKSKAVAHRQKNGRGLGKAVESITGRTSEGQCRAEMAAAAPLQYVVHRSTGYCAGILKLVGYALLV